MILPKNLQEKRDELAKNWTKGWNTLADSENSVIALNYKKGFNDCANLLLPEIEKIEKQNKKMKQALEKIVEMNYQTVPGDYGDRSKKIAKEALKNDNGRNA